MNDHVGITVLAKERRDRADTVVDIPAQQDAAAGYDILGDQQVDVAVVEAEEQASPEAADRHAAVALVEVVNIIVAAWIIELGRPAVDDGIHVLPLAIVDAGAGHVDADVGDRRNVLGIKNRQAFAILDVNRAHYQAVAVGELEMAIDPGLGVGGQQIDVELAGREHHL